MKCPDEGRLLLYLEHQLTPDEQQDTAEHLTICPVCSARLAELRENSDFAVRKLTGLWENRQTASLIGQQRVWQQLQRQSQFARKEVRTMKIKKFAIAAALVLALGAVGSMPAVQTAAANLLQVFRVEKVDTLTMTPGDMQKIEQAIYDGAGEINIEDFGTIKSAGESSAYQIDSAELDKLDFKVKAPTLTDEVAAAYSLQKTPVVEVKPNVEKINQLIKMLGGAYGLPAALDGKTCKFAMGDALISTYATFELSQGPAPEIEVPGGVNVQEVAQAMVQLPIWPDNVKTQLEAVRDWEHTLIIPDENAKKVSINGTDGIIAKHGKDRTLIWQEDGMLYMLQSRNEKEADLIAIAASLR